MKQHPFHMVEPSHWPISMSISLFILASGAVMFIHNHPIGNIIFGVGFVSVLVCMYGWWSQVIKEGKIGQHHTQKVRDGLRIGMSLFIVSEVMFFFAFFLSFFKASLFPVGVLDSSGLWVERAGTWPPKGIQTLDPWDIPIINTLILLLSGTTVTWAHHSIKENNQQDAVTALGITVLLGISFSLFQAFEYHHASFNMKDGIYGANFFMATGFHGLHVIIGTIFLAVCFFRARRGDFKLENGHLGFEFAAWYWHFVDVVWLFLFTFVYIWGS